MSTAPDGRAAGKYLDAQASEIEALAEDFVAFIEEFETLLSQGQIPLAFEKRLTRLQQRAKQLI